MTDEDFTFELTRRKALAAIGTVGAASAGAGLGTSAYFSDEETFEGNRLVAGSLDLKAAASQHYVDWLPDTDTNGNVSPPAPQETDDARMPRGDETPTIRLNPGSDGEDTKASPIELVLVDDDDDSDDDDTGDEPALEFALGSLVNTINGGVPPGNYTDQNGHVVSLCDIDAGADDDDAHRPVVDLHDVKPGDFGFIRFAFASCTNPAFVEFVGDVTDKAENGTTEPEADDPDEHDDRVELLDEIQLAVLNEDVYQLLAGDGVEASPQATLRDLDDGVRMPVAGDIPAEEGGGKGRNCFSGKTNHFGTLVWWLPIDHANEIQTDSAEFSLGIYAEQCRHNEGERVRKCDKPASEPVTLTSDVSDGIERADGVTTDSWLTATFDPGPVTTIEVDLDGEMYGTREDEDPDNVEINSDGDRDDEPDLPEWPSNPDAYVVEAVLDTDNDGLGESSNGDDLRIGYGPEGGYIKQNTAAEGDEASRTTVSATHIDGFTATESADQLTYTFEIDWVAVADDSDVPLSEAPCQFRVQETFAGDGGEGVGALPNSSDDGRGSIDTNLKKDDGTEPGVTLNTGV